MANVTVTIDGIRVSVPERTYMIDAARKIGIYIANYCYLPGLRAFGACRMCVVENKGRKGWELGISCSMAAQEGMEIRTLSDRVWDQRHMITELLDVDHPLDCPICEASGDCRLQDYGYEYGVIGKELRRPKIVRPAERLSPAIDIDRDRCIMCGRCVRACDEQIGAVALAFVQRGIETLIDAPFGKSLMDTPCTECGTCVEVCPVGALASRPSMHPVHHWQQRKTRTICQLCSVGCTLHVGVHNNLLAEVRSEDSVGINDGIICVKGRYAQDMVWGKDRLTTPLIREPDGGFRPAPWEEALDLVAAELTARRDRVGAVAGSKLTNEELYLMQKLMRGGLGSNNIDSDARYPEAEALDALEAAFGYAAMSDNLLDSRQKAGCILIVGDSLYETHPVYAYQLQRLIRIRDAKVIVISPRWNKMSQWASLILQPRPGTEETLLHGLAQLILRELLAAPGAASGSGAIDAWQQSLAPYTPEEVSARTGVPVAALTAAAYLYATGGQLEHPGERTVGAAPSPPYPPATILFSARGPYVLTAGAVRALCNLAFVTGNVGRPGGGVNPLVGDANTLGLNDMGCRPDRLPGYAALDAVNAARFGAAWTTDLEHPVQIPSGRGLSYAEMMESVQNGELRALWIAGANPVLAAADPEALHAALGRLEFLVVQDLYMNETAEMAHVVLPAVSFAEKEGTFTNTERRVQPVRRAMAPVGQARPDWRVFVELGYRLGLAMPYTQPADIMAEIATVLPLYGGITYGRLGATRYLEDAVPMPGAISYKQLRVTGLQWPCPTPEHPGTAVLYAEDGPAGAGLAPAPALGQAPVQPDDSLHLIAGFSLFPYRTGTWSRHSRSLAHLQPHSRLHLHPDDARRLGLRQAEQVRITATGEASSGGGETEAEMSGLNARPTEAITLVSTEVPAGSAFLAMTLAQVGRSPLVRRALAAQAHPGADGAGLSIAVRPLYDPATGDARLGPGPETAFVQDPANIVLPPE